VNITADDARIDAFAIHKKVTLGLCPLTRYEFVVLRATTRWSNPSQGFCAVSGVRGLFVRIFSMSTQGVEGLAFDRLLEAPFWNLDFSRELWFGVASSYQISRNEFSSIEIIVTMSAGACDVLQTHTGHVN
jgi:hypothetical protein